MIGLMEIWLDSYDKTSNRIKSQILCGLTHGLLDLLTVFFAPVMVWHYLQLENQEVKQADYCNWRYEERFQEQQGLSLTVPTHDWMEEGF